MKALLKRIKIIRLTYNALVANFAQQKVGASILLIIIVFLLGMFFAFVSGNPVLWPLVYPLF